MPLALTHFADPAPAPALDRPHRERLLEGDPQRHTWLRYRSADGLTQCGEWQCEVGAWRIQFDAGKEEYFCVQQGRLRVHDAAGAWREYGPGDACVIPPGFVGVFEVLEPVRKQFVLIDRAAQAAR